MQAHLESYNTYYKNKFRKDLFNFRCVIPKEGNKHYNENVFYIQYFYLTPSYNYLDVIDSKYQGFFAVALFWSILVDQVFYTYYKSEYKTFQKNTLYPKFIGNCTSVTVFNSQCGHHQHPFKILYAINDSKDQGNLLKEKVDIFAIDKRVEMRCYIDFQEILSQSKVIMKEEIKEYFNKFQPQINWLEFWMRCEREL